MLPSAGRQDKAAAASSTTAWNEPGMLLRGTPSQFRSSAGVEAAGAPVQAPCQCFVV